MHWEMLWPLWTPVGLFLLGLCAGSFLNVLVRRLPLMMERRWWWDTAQQLQDRESIARVCRTPENTAAGLARAGAALQEQLQALAPLDLMQPGSHCVSCGHRLRWHELIPLLSWWRLGGRCSACGASIGARLPGVELACGLLFVLMGLRWGETPLSLLWGAWAAMLLALALIDWDTLLLPDALTMPLLWSGLGAALLGWTVPLPWAVGGAMAGYGVLWLVATVFERLTGRIGMGAGDFKLLAALGAWLGPVALIGVVLIGSAVGALVGLVMKARGSLREGRYVPFGPFLALGGLMMVLLESHTVWPFGP